MKLYHVTISADRFPTSYTVEASGWGTAVSRAIRQWKKRFKGSRAGKMNIQVIKSDELLKEEAKDENLKN